MNKVAVRIFYPADPVGVVPGGIDTFIRGIVKSAPPELSFSLVGMTTDTEARPVGQWTRCAVGTGGQGSFDFFPVVAVADAGGRGRLPLSLRFTAGAWRHRAQLLRDFDVFDFHRPEPSLLYLGDTRPKNAFFHQDPKTIANAASDNLWRRLPAGYEQLESRAARQFASAWCVRESGVATLKQRYPALAETLAFLPTWVDADVFYPATDNGRQTLREQWSRELGISTQQPWIVFVGRLDTQKNPQLLLEAFSKLRQNGRDAVLLMVGDGVLRLELTRQAQAAKLTAHIRFLGLKPPFEIARLLQAADLFALTSAYEGMPMALLEALGCGTPAVVTDVGEVQRVVTHGSNGIIVSRPGAEAFAQGLQQALTAGAAWRSAAVAAVQAFQPATVLAPVYANYLALGQAGAHVRQTAAQQDANAGMTRQRETVVGMPIDVLPRGAVVAQLVRWSRDRQSRAVFFCNVHSAVLARRDPSHRQTLHSADLVVPDGAPIAWTLRRKGHVRQDRVDGPGTMWRVCDVARERGIKVGLYGATPQTLQALQAAMLKRFPGLKISYVHAPPFRAATAAEDAAVCRDIEAAGVGLLFVGLGCPKQERWIAEHRGRVPAVMLGLGAAFDFHAGVVGRAPSWMRNNGLEWLHRLVSEPRRLGWRYVSSNTVFLAATAGEFVRGLKTGAPQRTGPTKSAPTDLGDLADLAAAVAPNSQHFEASALRSEDTGGTMRSPVDQRAIDDLVARIDADMPAHRSRVVGFLASSTGEGTSTLARAFALANAEAMGRSVLLLSTGPAGEDRVSVLDAVRDGERITAALSKRVPSLTEAALGVPAVGDSRRSASWSLLARPELWRALRDSFELVVVDMQAADASDAALKVAPLCDGVVVVLEAAKTRAPVVTQLLHNLNAVHARVLGTVLNKRRFHLPARLYRWL